MFAFLLIACDSVRSVESVGSVRIVGGVVGWKSQLEGEVVDDVGGKELGGGVKVEGSEILFQDLEGENKGREESILVREREGVKVKVREEEEGGF